MSRLTAIQTRGRLYRAQKSLPQWFYCCLDFTKRVTIVFELKSRRQYNRRISCIDAEGGGRYERKERNPPF
jgi:hypothetical protein